MFPSYWSLLLTGVLGGLTGALELPGTGEEGCLQSVPYLADMDILLLRDTSLSANGGSKYLHRQFRGNRHFGEMRELEDYDKGFGENGSTAENTRFPVDLEQLPGSFNGTPGGEWAPRVRATVPKKPQYRSGLPVDLTDGKDIFAGGTLWEDATQRGWTGLIFLLFLYFCLGKQIRVQLGDVCSGCSVVASLVLDYVKSFLTFGNPVERDLVGGTGVPL